MVYCEDTPEPQNQFYFWPEYRYRQFRRGQNAIYVREVSLPRLVSGWFFKWLAGETNLDRELPDAQPPPAKPMNEPQLGTAASRPILIMEKCLSFTRYDGIQVNMPYWHMPMKKKTMQSAQTFHDLKTLLPVSRAFIPRLTRMNVSTQPIDAACGSSFDRVPGPD